MQKSMRRLAWILFVYYLLLLIWVILFKMSFSLGELDSTRVVNGIPFAQSTFPNGRVNLSEIISNILIFIPFGIYLSILCERWQPVKRAAVIAAASLALEALQYVFAVGISDITDLMGNTLGGIIGIAAHAMITHRSGDRARADKLLTILAAVGTAGCTALFLLLLIAN